MSRFLLIATLVIAGEMVFGLPFHTARFFRPTLLEVFGFSNTELGDLFAVYGVTAMLAYYPGGALADRYSTRGLLTVSLVLTAAGGLYMATIPGAVEMAALYGYWGITTIFLFWGALIRATRDWGGTSTQGMAFGILEAGRGFVAASFAAISVAVFTVLLPEAGQAVTEEERRAGFQIVILGYSSITLLAAGLAWLLIPVPRRSERPSAKNRYSMFSVLRVPVVWAQAGIIVCAYCGYKGLDNYSLYAVQVLGMNEVEAARFATIGAYLRPVAAIAAGLLADRFNAARTIAVVFAVMTASYAALSVLVADGSGLGLIYLNVFVSFFAVFALRGIYFALLEENRTPADVTGATVGLVSLVGYLPEIFFAPIAGRILDATPGVGGHHDYFVFLMLTAVAGVATAIWMLRYRGRRRDALWPEEIKG